MNEKLKDILKSVFSLVKESDPEFDFQKLFEETIEKGAKLHYVNLNAFDVIESKNVEGGLLKIKVIASSESLDRGNDIVKVAGITTPNAKHNMIPMFLEHNSEKILGAWTKWYVEDDKFIMEGIVSKPNSEWAKDAVEKIEAKILNGISIGFMAVEMSYNEETEVRVFNEIELFEASVVSIPMNQDCHITDIEKIGKSEEAEQATEEAQSEEETQTESVEEDPESKSLIKEVEETPASKESAEAPAEQTAEETEEPKPTVESLKEEVNSLRQLVKELEAEMEQATQALQELLGVEQEQEENEGEPNDQ